MIGSIIALSTNNLNVVAAMLEHPATRLTPMKEVSMLNILPKKCSKCGEWKSRSEFYDDNRKDNKKSKDGKRPVCKACKRELSKLEHIANPQAHNARTLRWKHRNPEKVAEQSHKWYAANAERKYETHKAWVDNNRPKISEYNRNSKARRRGGNGEITAQEWQALKEFYDYTCLCCRQQEPEITLTLDHVLPLSLGGSNTMDNAQPLCGSCNSTKHNKHIDYRKDWK
jgi:5-methylcytosine-specific restriction endonuclease McrA